MKLKKLTVQNFLSIKHIELSLENQGLVLLQGINKDNESLNNNGAGKSSIIESLVYAIYARTLRGLKGDSVVNNVVGKNMKIWLDIEDDDGTEYRIARYRKHSTNKNKSFLFKGKTDITPKSESDFNDAVADLLQADYVTFTSSLLYSAESFKFTSATDSEMKSTFDNMLGLDVYQKCLDITRSRLKAIENELSNTQWKIDDKKNKIDQLTKEIDCACIQRQQYEDKLVEKKLEFKNKLKELMELKADYEIELQKLTENKTEAEKAKTEAENRFQSIQEKCKNIDKLKSIIEDTKDSIAKIDRNLKKNQSSLDFNDITIKKVNQKISNCNSDIATLTQKMLDLSKTIGQPCPTCGHPLTEESLEPARKEYQSKIDSIQVDIKGYNDQIKDLNDENKQLQLSNDSLSKEKDGYLEELNKYDDLLQKSKSILDDKDNADSLVKSTTKAYYASENLVNDKKREIQNVDNFIERVNNELDNQDTSNPYDEIIIKYKSDSEKCSKDIEDLKSSIADKLEEKECLQFWQIAYSNQGIKSFVLDDITPFLNKRANKYLSKLASGHLEVKFSTSTTLKSGETREKFSIEVYNTDGGSEYSANSGGERRRIDLAVNLALSDLLASRSTKRINVAIYDEVFDAVDSVGIEKIIELLQELSKEKSSIFVISHNDHLKSYFTNTITVVKENGCSTLLEAEPEESIDEE